MIANELPAWLLGVGTLFIGLAAFGTFLVADRQKKAADKQAETRAMIEAIVKEFKPNGGSSTRDSLNRLEAGHARLEHRLDGIERRLTKNEQATDDLEDAITTPKPRTRRKAQ